MRRWGPWLVLALLGAAFWLAGTPTSNPVPAEPWPAAAAGTPSAQPGAASTQRYANRPGVLPPEAIATVALIQGGGPFPHRQDGGVFGNREGLLPRQARGWYREYTVGTPGLQHRGARRIVTGGTPPSQWFYTDDHYDSFRQFDPQRALP